ncbi:hypothetical protein HYU13_04895 [Candidatus Woesearchaeota archaeon]|nr:hypothetical protein [Candidatus Woesearchaeota archaeon]
MKWKSTIAFGAILLLFLFQVDLFVVKTFDKPDISCVVDEDCTISGNIYAGCGFFSGFYTCPTFAHNKKWKFYEPLIKRIFAIQIVETGLPACVNKTCIECPPFSQPQTGRCALVFSKFIKDTFEGKNISKISKGIRERGICENITDLAMKTECRENFRFVFEG